MILFKPWFVTNDRRFSPLLNPALGLLHNRRYAHNSDRSVRAWSRYNNKDMGKGHQGGGPRIATTRTSRGRSITQGAAPQLSFTLAYTLYLTYFTPSLVLVYTWLLLSWFFFFRLHVITSSRGVGQRRVCRKNSAVNLVRGGGRTDGPGTA